MENISLYLYDLIYKDSEQALKHLYLHYFAKLLRYVSIYVHSTGEAEEIISDTFLAIWENRKTLLVDNFESYLYSIARNKSISTIRRYSRLNTVELEENYIDLFVHTSTTPEDDLISQEQINEINKAINTLPDKCKEAFKLIREEKMKYKEAAAILGISVKTLEAHLTLAMKKLREVLL